MTRGLGVVLVLVGTLAMSGPVFAAGDWPDSVDQYVARVRDTISTIDMDGYLAAVKNPNGALLLDVREEDEFNAGHVPGTVNIPRGLLEFRIWTLLGYPGQIDTRRKIYVQCKTGYRAALATRQLAEIGFTNATAVIMQLTDWEKNGNPLVKP